MTEKILFIGGCGHGKPTTNGVAAKNYYLLSRLKELSTDVKTVDTDGWKRNPLILLRLCLLLSFFRKHKIVISLNTPSAYKFICVANKFFPRRRLCYFVIGGVLADYMREGKVLLQPYKCVDWFMVESLQMKEQMRPQALKQIQTRLVLEEVAKDAHLETTDLRLEEEIDKIAKRYQMETDKIKETMGDYERKQMKKDIAVQEAISLIIDTAKEV